MADFGLARLNTSLCSDALKQIQGTIAYMAPELVEGTKYTTKSDVCTYHPADGQNLSVLVSIAIIFWEMIYKLINGTHIQPYSDKEESKGNSCPFIKY